MPSATQPDEITLAKPRILFIPTTALLIVFYTVFAASNVNVMRGMRAAQPTITMPNHELPQSDYARFWYVGRRLLSRVGGVAPPDPGVFPLDILSPTAPALKAWLYPPPTGLLAMPFAVLPLALSFWVWRILSLALGLWLLRRAELGWAVVLAGLASPAALHDMTGGQNGTLTGAMLVASLLLAERQQRFAGTLAGLLCIKPQIALAVPAAFLRTRFLCLLYTAVSVVLSVVLLCLFVEGGRAWVRYFTVAQPDSTAIVSLPFTVFFPAAGITVLSMLRSMHCGVGFAWLCQISVSLLSVSLVWLAWHRGTMQGVPRMAFTCCLGVLAMPYGFSYDLVAFSIGMAALFFRAGQWERLVLGLLWLMGGYTITLANYTGLLLFPLWAACGAVMAWRLRASPAAQ